MNKVGLKGKGENGKGSANQEIDDQQNAHPWDG